MSADDLQNTGDRGAGQQTMDDQLFNSLQAFGRTLESEVDGNIRPGVARSDEGQRRHRAVAWLAAAAVLVAAGFGLGVLWPDGSASIDSVDSVDSVDSEDGTDGDDPAADDATDGAPTSDGESTDGPEVLGLGPSTIVDRTGAPVATVDTAERMAAADAPTNRAEVIIDAVADEVIRLDIFPGADRAEVAERLSDGGLSVEVTLDPAIHDAVIASIDEVYPNELGVSTEPGAVIIDNETGAIVAIASRTPTWDGLTQTPRPVGSAFKSIVLAAAYRDGLAANDNIDADGPCAFANESGDVYTVGGSERAEQSLAAVTRSSNNCAFTRLTQIVGPDRVVALAEDVGLTLPDDAEDLVQLPLGIAEASAVELAGAYAAFVNDGVHRAPRLIQSIQDRDGQVLFEHRDDGQTVLGAQTARLVTQTLETVVEAGTGRRAQLTGWPSAGKTGTTAQFTNAWFVGYTPRYTGAVWLGNDDPDAPIRIPEWTSFGGGLPTQVWGTAMNRIHADLPPEAFAEPDPPTAASEPRLLEADDELPLCDPNDRGFVLDGPAQGVDTDTDGVADCYTIRN